MKFWWMFFTFLLLVDITEFQTIEAYSSVGLTNVKYNTNKQSVVEKEKVTVQIGPNIITDWKEMQFSIKL
jgi:hypothetical protein